MKNTLFTCVLSLLLVFSANAQRFEWTGAAGDGKWESAGNWSWLDDSDPPSPPLVGENGKYPQVLVKGHEVTLSSACANTGLRVDIGRGTKLKVQKDFEVNQLELSDSFFYSSKGAKLSTQYLRIYGSSRIFMQGGSLIGREPDLELISYGWEGLNVAPIDLGGGTIEGINSFRFNNTELSGNQKLGENMVWECVSQCLISNGDPASLATLLTKLSLSTGSQRPVVDILELEDGTEIKKYTGKDWENDEAKDSYYLNIKDGSLYVDYWRTRLDSTPSGELVPEPSAASLGLLALSALLMRRRRA